jgi:hypothetical protein
VPSPWHAVYIGGPGSDGILNGSCAVRNTSIDIVSQSSTANVNFNVVSSSPEDGSQNVSFSDMNPAFDTVIGSDTDPTRMVTDLSDAGLGDFLSRPILIKTINWGPGINLNQTFDPWSLFFNNKRNINRIANFNLLRAKLCVKFTVNGNGFYYGRCIASYNPLPGVDELLPITGNFEHDFVAISQRPHIYINPTECQGGSLCLPFYHPNNALSIPRCEWDQMGRVSIQDINNLKQANGANEAISICVFAWAEDVSLSVPTSTNPVNIVSQADEYGTGPISRPASIVARWSGKLSNVPIIGRYARATEIAAGVAGKFASLFGFSRPCVLDETKSFKPSVFGQLAITNQPDPAVKLSLDIKQETTIDPRVAGIGSEDEMSFLSMVNRESYYTQFAWAVATAPGDRLFSTYVEPTVSRFSGSALTGWKHHLSPACFVANNFEQWGGTMIYRFQIVASNFHRGRLRFTWDPYDGEGDEYNTMYQRIVDIADCKDVTISVGWGQEMSFIDCTDPFYNGTSGPVGSYSVGAGPINTLDNPYRGNGVLSVSVVNDLTVPTTTLGLDNDIQINVFTKMGTDFRFGKPTIQTISGVTYFDAKAPAAIVSQSDTIEQGGAGATGEEEQDSAPISTSVDHTFGKEADPEDPTYHVFYGEEITSMRQLMKRYFYHMSYRKGNENSKGLRLRQPDFPYYQGYNPDAHLNTTAGDPYSWSTQTYLNYFTPAFSGYRGALRWKYMRSADCLSHEPTGFAAPGAAITMSASRFTGDSSPYVTGGQPYEPFLLDAPHWPSCISSGPVHEEGFAAFHGRFLNRNVGNGAALTSILQNSALELELPFYSQKRFFNARKIRNLQTIAPNMHGSPKPGVHEVVLGPNPGMVDAYCSIAEDFQLLFFVNVPTMMTIGGGSPQSLPDPSTT